MTNIISGDEFQKIGGLREGILMFLEGYTGARDKRLEREEKKRQYDMAIAEKTRQFDATQELKEQQHAFQKQIYDETAGLRTAQLSSAESSARIKGVQANITELEGEISELTKEGAKKVATSQQKLQLARLKREHWGLLSKEQTQELVNSENALDIYTNEVGLGRLTSEEAMRKASEQLGIPMNKAGWTRIMKLYEGDEFASDILDAFGPEAVTRLAAGLDPQTGGEMTPEAAQVWAQGATQLGSFLRETVAEHQQQRMGRALEEFGATRDEEGNVIGEGFITGEDIQSIMSAPPEAQEAMLQSAMGRGVGRKMRRGVVDAANDLFEMFTDPKKHIDMLTGRNMTSEDFDTAREAYGAFMIAANSDNVSTSALRDQLDVLRTYVDPDITAVEVSRIYEKRLKKEKARRVNAGPVQPTIPEGGAPRFDPEKYPPVEGEEPPPTPTPTPTQTTPPAKAAGPSVDLSDKRMEREIIDRSTQWASNNDKFYARAGKHATGEHKALQSTLSNQGNVSDLFFDSTPKGKEQLALKATIGKVTSRRGGSARADAILASQESIDEHKREFIEKAKGALRSRAKELGATESRGVRGALVDITNESMMDELNADLEAVIMTLRPNEYAAFLFGIGGQKRLIR